MRGTEFYTGIMLVISHLSFLLVSQMNYSSDLVLKWCNKFQDIGTEIVNVVWQSLREPFRKWTSHAAETLNWQSIEQIASGGQLQRGVELPLDGLFTTYTNCLQPINFISKSVSSDWLQESQWVLARRFTQPTFSLEFWISWRHVLSFKQASPSNLLPFGGSFDWV